MFFCLEKKILHFKQPAGTSRGVYTTRKIWLVHLTDGERTGMGECAPLPDLSCDALPDETYESKLNSFCQDLCQETQQFLSGPLPERRYRCRCPSPLPFDAVRTGDGTAIAYGS